VSDTNLNTMDVPPLESMGQVVETSQPVDLSPDMKRWLANLVDVFNSNMNILQGLL